MTPSLLLAVFLSSIVAQAARPAWRTEILLGGAGLALLLLVGAGRDARLVFAALPWDVLIILGSLGVLSRLIADSQLFARLAVAGTRSTGADPAKIVVSGAAAMFLVSGLVNNLTALLLVLPIILSILGFVGTNERHLRWTVGTLLVSCNLGGASTPIGDFPAILLLGGGEMSFVRYVSLAFPIASAGLVVLLVLVHFLVRPARGVEAPTLRRALTLAAVEALHARVRLDTRRLTPAVACLAGMLAAWTFIPARDVPPHLIAWLGSLLAVALTGSRGRDALLRGFDTGATLFLFALFVLVGCVRETGLFADLARGIEGLPVSDGTRLVLLVTATAVATGLFSAGPSMAGMLEAARPLADTLGADAVFIGLAFGVCAGSSLFITAATSGPLAQSLVDQAGMVDGEGRPLRFTFNSFLPVGILAFVVILATGLAAIQLVG